jgi:DNA-binding protein YbaB
VTRLVRPELQIELRSALFQAFEAGKATVARPVKVKFNGQSRLVYLSVKPARRGDESESFALVIFNEAEEAVEETSAEDVSTVAEERLGEELRHTRQRLQTVVEDGGTGSDARTSAFARTVGRSSRRARAGTSLRSPTGTIPRTASGSNGATSGVSKSGN